MSMLGFHLASTAAKGPKNPLLDLSLFIIGHYRIGIEPLSLISVACCSKVTKEQHVQADGHTDRLPPRGDHHAVIGPPQHYPTLWCGAHTAPQNGKMCCCLLMFEHRQEELTEGDIKICSN